MPKEQEHMDFTGLVAWYLSGELSGQERSAFEELLQADPEKERLFREFKRTWEDAGKPGRADLTGEELYDLDAEWELLRRKLPQEDFGKVRKGRAAEIHGRSLFNYTWRIAAALLVGVVFAFAWIYATRLAGTEVVVAENEPVEVLLEDGSTVTINRDSRLRYRSRFGDAQRKVYLTGEAWFDVAGDTTRPFIIDAGGALVEVLGTRFNVNAYRDNPTVEITVESGIVALTSRQDQKDQVILRAGNTGTFHRQNKQLELIHGIDPNAVSWMTRELIFNETPLRMVAELIGKVYNTEVELVNPELSSCTITVTFKDQSLDAVLHVLEMTLDLLVTIEDDRICLDGEGCEDQ